MSTTRTHNHKKAQEKHGTRVFTKKHPLPHCQHLRPRPLSPHLIVYKVQLTAFLSITHRLSEILLWFVAVVATVILCLTPSALDALLLSRGGHLAGTLFLIVFLYHILGLLRHFLLHKKVGFKLSHIYFIGWSMLLLWLSLSILFLGHMYGIFS